jgi:hypothetical protein
MKRILPVIAVFILFAGLVLTSCNTGSRLCPAYPPSVYQGDVLQNDDARTVIEMIDLQDKNL